MQLYFTTIFRGAALADSGEIFCLDWDRKQIIASAPIVPATPAIKMQNPRGGGRGGRGITRLGDQIVAASYHTLHVFDRQLTPQFDISHHQFVGLHEIHSYRPDHVWVTSTVMGLALEMNTKTGETTRTYWARELPDLQSHLDTSPLVVDKSADNRVRYLSPDYISHPHHLHLNVVARWRGEMYALIANRGTIINLDKQTVVVADPAIHPGHNLHILDDGTAIVLGSHSQTIRWYDLTTGELLQFVDLSKIKAVQDLVRWPLRKLKIKRALRRRGKSGEGNFRALFLRGLDLAGRKLFVGANPAVIFCFDVDSGRLEDYYAHSDDIHLCVHGLLAVED